MKPLPILASILTPMVVVVILGHFSGPNPAPMADVASAEAASGGCWHVVQDGENLRAIARRYYGSARYWRTVQVANDVGLRPDPGRRLWVPGHMPELP
ncbi:MAG: LysM domain-containing protein [Planctomycetota bacterium]|jgi:hypothetical protein|nr:LysM domain-containing protein [Planctomycetota bacterium]